MRFIRSILAVIVGYAVFAVSAGALFYLSGQDPHGETTAPFIFADPFLSRRFNATLR